MKFAGIVRDNLLVPKNEWIKHIEHLKENVNVKASSQNAGYKTFDFKEEFVKAIEKRLPKKKFGILFSGGIDSTLIAFACKKLNADFVCYTVGLENSPDIISAEEVAKKQGFELKKKMLSMEDIEKTIKTIVKLVGPDTMKVGVGSVVYEAAKLAKKDKIDYLFSGLGSEEIFAGYERHALSKDINEECWSGLKTMNKRDFERDFAVAKKLKVEIAVPFLDEKVIVSAMQIPGSEKIKEGIKKYALRKFAEELGLKDAWRKKQAAQYGSYFDKAIEKLARNFRTKRNYLNSLFNIGAMVSSGKDSIYAMYLMQKQDFPVKCMLTLKSKNPDSYMFHTPAIDMVKLQSESVGIPLIEQETKGEKEDELKDLKKILEKAKKEYEIDGISTGALFSNYQRERIEKVAGELGLKVFSPLWQMEQEKEVREIIANGFKFIFTKVAAEGLDKSWLGKEIVNSDVDKLVVLNKKLGINIAGEGGEYESLVIDGPIFKKRIVIEDFEIKEESKNTATLFIKKAKLTEKSIYL
jgi:asparagine synthase (glutamine-hydrolysing)